MGQAVGGEASDDGGEEASFEVGGVGGEGSDEGGGEGSVEKGGEASYEGGEDSDEGRESSVEKRDADHEAEPESEEREEGTEERGEASEDGGEASVNGSEHYERAQDMEEDNDEEGNASREPSGGNDQQTVGAVGIREVFGDSEEDEEVEGHVRHEPSPQPMSERAHSDNDASDHGGVRPQDVVMDEEDRYDSEEEQQSERKPKEKPVGPPLNLVIPLQPPPARSEKMNLVRVSNIMDIEPKQFDPKTYVEEETFVTDEAGQKQRLRLEENVARWRIVQNRDNSISYESNARFVKWSDGSMQLLIGNEVLDLSVQDAQQDQSHIFVRHPKSILQSQGRLLRKMRFMPSSLTSKSHRLLTALVDKQHRKVYKVKNIVTTFDPEKDKEEKEKALEQQIRSREDLQRKQEKINRKYLPAREREPQLSPGYLEGALEEEEERDEYNEGKKSLDARRFQEQLEAEGRAEKRIINAKRQTRPIKDTPLKHAKERLPPPRSKPEVEESFSEESEGEPSEYESDPQEAEVGFNDEAEQEGDEEAEEEEEEEEEDDRNWRSEERGRSQLNEEKRYGERDDESSRKRKDREREDEYSPEASPPRKTVQRRRVVVSDSEGED
ncbi:hypothetical protein O6H91_15G024300 [Diphasiastrum complanatum]|nr:hypothetical protein O6H91_15G024300 [Diphasiastrum complanatum]